MAQTQMTHLFFRPFFSSISNFSNCPVIINQKSADMLDMFEQKVLRRIFGPVNEGGQWRMRRNEELYQEASLSTFVRLQHLWWYGHLRRMGEERLAQRVFGVPGQGEGLETDGLMQ